MQKFLFSALFIVIGLVGAVFVVPNFISWNEYRDVIANKVFDATGINVEIRGDIRLGILPSPALLINGVHIANIEGAMTADTLTVDTFKMRISLAPLIARRLQISEVKLINPRLSLEVLSDGRTNMTFKKPLPKGLGFLNTEKFKSNYSNKNFLDTLLDFPQFSPLSIRVDDFVVQNGSVTYRNDIK